MGFVVGVEETGKERTAERVHDTHVAIHWILEGSTLLEGRGVDLGIAAAFLGEEEGGVRVSNEFERELRDGDDAGLSMVFAAEGFKGEHCAACELQISAVSGLQASFFDSGSGCVGFSLFV